MTSEKGASGSTRRKIVWMPCFRRRDRSMSPDWVVPRGYRMMRDMEEEATTDISGRLPSLVSKSSRGLSEARS